MKIVYRAAHSADAHLVSQLLEQEGMTAFVSGGLLEGAAGGLPTGGLATVSVADEHAERARQVVRDWESMPVPTDEESYEGDAVTPPPLPPAPPQGRGASPLLFALIGAVFGALLTWGFMRMSVQTLDTDLSGDEVPDEHVVFDGDRIVRVETDRNRDGNADDIVHFDKQGRPAKVAQDEDFDGRLETTTSYSGGSWRTTVADYDADGEPDYRADAEHGVLASEEWRDVKQNVVKRIRYEKGQPVSGVFDSDGDGGLDTERSYDARGEILSATPMGR
ncbi:DUF2007 domain-containing protein [Lysobacter sp. 5GHs7-4]|uniref:putative signal transducing protein n=1 Tax=Lysobacter sp. 5GHs7-4 TaxID=2904253 RepID=UPI001E57ED9B|nr:DUF2007 domain-containing protein [Lysobacter sp. 5GHs7-4]UHQ23755.1 DUF2007 domain-containing protein [Lysobacter sp. 5GHs7-4]